MTTETVPAATTADIVATYRGNLAQAITERPDDYPPDAATHPDEYAAFVAGRLVEILASPRGLRGFNIDSRAWRLTAKAYGIPNTYKAWTPFLAAAAPALEPDPRCWVYLHTQGGPRRCTVEPDHHDGPHDYAARA